MNFFKKCIAVGVACLAFPAAAEAERLTALVDPPTAGPPQLVTFDSATPGTTTTLSISGVPATETLRGLDYRPATGQLYAVSAAAASANNSIVFVYVINPTTGQASLVGASAAALAGWGDVVSGVDFNPTVDRIRITNVNDENARMNPDTGALAANDTDLTASADIADTAYDRNVVGATLTTLFAINRATGSLARIGGVDGTPSPNGGVVTDVGSLAVALDATKAAGFDISGATGVGFAGLTTTDGGAASRLYTVNLATGAATAVGTIGAGAGEVYGLTRLPDPTPGPAGPAGPAGTNGTNGAAGTNGTNGTNGAEFDKLAVGIANGSYRARAGRGLPVRVVSTLAGVGTLRVVRNGKVLAKTSATVRKGRTTLRIARLPARGSYTLRLTVTAGAQTASDTASLRITR